MRLWAAAGRLGTGWFGRPSLWCLVWAARGVPAFLQQAAQAGSLTSWGSGRGMTSEPTQHPSAIFLTTPRLKWQRVETSPPLLLKRCKVPQKGEKIRGGDNDIQYNVQAVYPPCPSGIRTQREDFLAEEFWPCFLLSTHIVGFQTFL